ncbi:MULTISPECIES: amidase family protein [Bacillus]|uniref:amidase family protein n=1 Tax=Bacillus TaxID=1386 RepID=UPI000BB86393|nr:MULTISPECIES: amidase family protein [Bacillus]
MWNPRLVAYSKEYLLEATIGMLQRDMEEGKITSRDLVLMYLDRIAIYDKEGSGINSILEVNPDAVQIAESLDVERVCSGARGPLHGIPVLLKDNIDTADKMHTSAGSLSLAANVAEQDSFVATQLRKAGAVILGKTNMTEWANFMSENMPSGYSSRGGQVQNPYGPGNFDVGGSSSGSGAAIAANFATVAIGTETSGSILSPASSNSLVGIKPTVGLVSRTGIIPIAHSQDTAGPMARTVKDAALLLSVISEKDSSDPATLTNPIINKSYEDFLQSENLNGITIGVAKDPFFSYLTEEEKGLMESVIGDLRALGATVVEEVEIPSSKEKWDYNTLIYEFKPDLNAYLKTTSRDVPVSNLKEVIEFNLQEPNTRLKYGQTLLTKCEDTSGSLTEKEYVLSREKDIYLSQEQGIDATLATYSLDAILTPNNFGAGIPAKAGYPSITVPAGYSSEGKPIGATFTSGAYEEGKLIQIGYAYEQKTKHRKPPVLEN